MIAHLFSLLALFFHVQPYTNAQPSLLHVRVRSQLNGVSKARWQVCSRPARAAAIAVMWERGMQRWQLTWLCVSRKGIGTAAPFTVCYIIFSRKMRDWKNLPSVHTKGRLSLAASSVTGFGAAGREVTGWFQSQLKKRLSCSLAVLCLGFCPLFLQPSGVSFCESLFSVVCRTLRISRNVVAGESRLILMISGRFVWDSSKKYKKGARPSEPLCWFFLKAAG